MLNVEINSFSYSEKTVLKKVHFTLKSGEHMSILGESGCGKSTLLHLIYGLLPLKDGQILYNGKKLLGPEHALVPGEPFMKLVAQEFNIMPFSTVGENLGTYLSRMDEEKDEHRINELLSVVDMASFKHVLVKNLSGGQKQRVALAKALANEPKILLLDEPFSDIDSFRKNKLRRNLFRYLKQNSITCLTATHDSDEALAFSDTIMMLKNGSVEMFGSPEEVYANASTIYQASFFGDPNCIPKNLLWPESSSEKIIVFPHQICTSASPTPLSVTVRTCYFKGSHYLVKADYQGEEIYFFNGDAIAGGTELFLKPKTPEAILRKKTKP